MFQSESLGSQRLRVSFDLFFSSFQHFSSLTNVKLDNSYKNIIIILLSQKAKTLLRSLSLETFNVLGSKQSMRSTQLLLFAARNNDGL